MAAFRRFIPSIVAFLAQVILQLAGYQSLTLAVILSVLIVVLAVMGGWPWPKRWRPFTLVPVDAEPSSEADSSAQQETEKLKTENDELKAENEKLKRIQDDRRRDLIESWRDYFDDYNYAGGNIRETGPYFAIRPHLKREIVDRLEGPRPLLISTVRPLLLDKVTRLEQEWESGSTGPQLTPPETDEELKRQCNQLAEELAKFLDAWENYKHQPKIFPEKPWAWSQYTMERYRETLEPKLVNLLDDLEQSKWITAETRAHLPLLTNDPYKIREMAARLRGICCRH